MRRSFGISSLFEAFGQLFTFFLSNILSMCCLSLGVLRIIPCFHTFFFHIKHRFFCMHFCFLGLLFIFFASTFSRMSETLCHAKLLSKMTNFAIELLRLVQSTSVL